MKPIIDGISPFQIYSEPKYRPRFKYIDKVAKNYIFVLIHKNATREDVDRLSSQLRKHMKNEKRIRTANWGMYLATYDLITGGECKEKTSKGLRILFPKDNKGKERAFDDKKIRDYYRTALALINSGYKEYLFA